MMNIKCLALVISVAIPAAASAQAPTVVESRSATVVSTNASTTAKSEQGLISLASGTYVIDFIVKGTTTGTVGAYSFLREGLKSTNQIIDVVAYFFKPKAAGGLPINESITFRVENGADKFFLWESSVYAQGAEASYSTTITAVPGPEAGAGLGAVALGGIALFLTRRRDRNAALA